MHFRWPAAIAIVFALLVPALAQNDAGPVIQQSRIARGGLARLRRIQSLESEGILRLPNGAEARIHVYSRRPDRVRMEMTLGGETTVQGFDGKTAWQVAGTHPAEVLTGVAADRVRDQATFGDMLLDPERTGDRMERIGPDQASGRACTRVKITLPSGDVFTQCIDTQTGLAIHEEMEPPAATGKGITIEEIISDYRPVAGVLFPFRYVSGPKGSQQQATLTILHMQANRPMDDALFRIPPAKGR